MSERSEIIKQTAAGAFFFIGILLIVFFVFTIGKDKGFARPKFEVYVLFNNVGGLVEGAPIRLSGVSVGNVSSIDFVTEDKSIDSRRVRVTMGIYEKFRPQFDSQVKFAIHNEGILGEKLIEISKSDKEGEMDFSKSIIGEDPINVQNLAAVFTGAAESFTRTSDLVGQLDVVSLSSAMKESAHALHITAKGLNDLSDELEDMTRKALRLLDRIEQRVIEGELFSVF